MNPSTGAPYDEYQLACHLSNEGCVAQSAGYSIDESAIALTFVQRSARPASAALRAAVKAWRAPPSRGYLQWFAHAAVEGVCATGVRGGLDGAKLRLTKRAEAAIRRDAVAFARRNWAALRSVDSHPALAGYAYAVSRNARRVGALLFHEPESPETCAGLTAAAAAMGPVALVIRDGRGGAYLALRPSGR